ncbi:diacylglycerol/lipid kinase family protein [Maritalea sp.]|uniref:diacylglycerol/lipid kinase family protein n=1 Tax=Maritalea sp. TaxID=2003361 RepID=UPI003EF6987A
MKFAILLNKDGGTLKNIDVEHFAERIETVLTAKNHETSIHIVSGDAIKSALADILADEELDVVVAGGGDGTVSLVVSEAWKNKKCVAVLPAGTMNLFARSIGMSLDLELSIAQIADGRRARVDIVTADDMPILHQYSIGLQAAVVKKRDQVSYRSRLSKILAGVVKYFDTIARPPVLDVTLKYDDQDARHRVSLLCITNNLYGRGHLPFADGLDQGKIGIYWAPPLAPTDYVKLTSDFVLGSWETNEHLTELSTDQVTLILNKTGQHKYATIDGELVDLEDKIEFKLHRSALEVIKPNEV